MSIKQLGLPTACKSLQIVANFGTNLSALFVALSSILGRTTLDYPRLAETIEQNLLTIEGFDSILSEVFRRRSNR